MGKDPETTSKLPNNEFGLGDEAYIGGLDIFHVLHCFNEIRKEAFKDYFWDAGEHHTKHPGSSSYSPKRKHSEIFWIHLRHCTDIVVQNLMCNADATMYTYVWMESQKTPYPDFYVNKKCRDFEALKKWRDENGLDINRTSLIRKPEGAHELEMDEMYWKLYGNETTPGDATHHVH